jgi:hypothetical protein
LSAAPGDVLPREEEDRVRALAAAPKRVTPLGYAFAEVDPKAYGETPTPLTDEPLRGGSLARTAREQESDALTPLDKTRSALEAKAAKGDVYAARELREHADHYYGSAATGDAWKELLTAEELETVLAVFDAARSRAQGTAPA